jgi:endoribonuclease Dicer
MAVPRPQEHSGSDSEADIENEGPKTTKERKRLQNDIFAEFASKMSERITADDIKRVKSEEKDENLSIKDLLAKQEANKIINPRDYQIELFELAKNENIIAVLDTGTGKTHIATLLLQHVLDRELQDRQNGKSPRTAFFLVDSVNLVYQQSNVLYFGLDQPVEGLTGAHGRSLWSKSTWKKVVAENKVLICTAKILEDALLHSFIKISQINLLVFDEAHHAKQNHPYAR